MPPSSLVRDVGAPARSPTPPASVPRNGAEILAGPARKTSVTTLRRSGAENTLLQSCMYFRFTCAKKHIKPYICPGSCKWVALGRVSLQADARPQKCAYLRQILNPKPQTRDSKKGFDHEGRCLLPLLCNARHRVVLVEDRCSAWVHCWRGFSSVAMIVRMEFWVRL